MAEMATLPLLSMVIITIITSYVIAWFYRDDYDPKKMLKAYLIYFLPGLLLGILLQVKLILLLGIYLLGGIVLVFRNSTYFNQ